MKTFLILAAAAFTLLTMTIATASTLDASIQVSENLRLIYQLPNSAQPDLFGCLAVGNVEIAKIFSSDFRGQRAVYVDQLNIATVRGGALRYTAGLSSQVDGGWEHREYEVSLQYVHSCTFSGATLLRAYRY